MKGAIALFVIFLTLGCTKKDFQAYRNYQKKNACVMVSMNADRQNSDEFYVIKTYNQYGVLTHLKTQIRDLNNTSFVYDYDITYAENRAIFKGSTRVLNWVFDNPPSEDEYETPFNPDAPQHAEEQTELRDTRDFEIILDHRTHFPIEVRYRQSRESLLKLSYDNRGYLKKVGAFNVTTDQRGNILSLETPPYEGEYYHGQTTGVYYYYGTRELAKVTRQFYETPNIFIHPMYSILEILNWGPFQPNLERTGFGMGYDYGDEAYPVQPWIEGTYTNHQYDNNGNLVRYTFNGNFYRAIPYYEYGNSRQVNRSIVWQCGGRNVK